MTEIAQYLGTGKRKTSIARVILRPGDGQTWINGRTLDEYFPRPLHRKMVLAPLEVAEAASTRNHSRWISPGLAVYVFITERGRTRRSPAADCSNERLALLVGRSGPSRR